jgi:hypothetical protein
MKRVIFGATAAVVLAFVGTPAALAAAPKGGWAPFAQCPVHTPGVEACLYVPVEGGYLTLGKTVVPITKTMTLQGGTLEQTEAGVSPFVAALDGETLTKSAQPLPGGLFGLQLEAVTEVAGPASSILLHEGLFGEGLSVTLPLKVRLVNPLLGAECSIGSNSHPIEVNATTGTTSGGLVGDPGEKTSIEHGRILVVRGVSMIGGGFVVPKAGGCGSALVNEAIDAKLEQKHRREAQCHA